MVRAWSEMRVTMAALVWCALASVVREVLRGHLRDSIVVSISACHVEDPGSIPGRGAYLFTPPHTPPPLPSPVTAFCLLRQQKRAQPTPDLVSNGLSVYVICGGDLTYLISTVEWPARATAAADDGQADRQQVVVLKPLILVAGRQMGVWVAGPDRIG